jgi:hypothetical protein
MAAKPWPLRKILEICKKQRHNVGSICPGIPALTNSRETISHLQHLG